MLAPKIIIAGAPASGKGTQCEFIKAEFGCIHLSTGDMLRAAVEAGSDLGKEAKGHMDSGGLVPDKLIIDIIIARLAEADCVKKGWLLDGFPRTRAQADALATAGLSCDCFLLLDVPDHLLVERVCGRRADPVTGQIYHIKYKPPETEEIAARLTQRSDDTEEAIMVRVKNFHANVAAIIDAYNTTCYRFNGARDPKVVWSELKQCIPRACKKEIVFTLGSNNNNSNSGSSVSAGGMGADSNVKSISTAIAAASGYSHIHMSDLLKASTDELIINSLRKNSSDSTGSGDVEELINATTCARMLLSYMMKNDGGSNSNSQVKKWLVSGYIKSIEHVTAFHETMTQEYPEVSFYIDTVFHLQAPAAETEAEAEAETEAERQTNAQTTAIANDSATTTSKLQEVLSLYKSSNQLRTITIPKGLGSTMPMSYITNKTSSLFRSGAILPVYERTFAMLKPDAVRNGSVKAILDMISAANLNVTYTKLITINDHVANNFYSKYNGQAFFAKLKNYICSGPAVVMVLEGTNAIETWRTLLGPTNPSKAMSDAPHSVRALYGTDSTENAAHGSDGILSAAREIEFWTSVNGMGNLKCKEENLNDESVITVGEGEESSEAAIVDTQVGMVDVPVAIAESELETTSATIPIPVPIPASMPIQDTYAMIKPGTADAHYQSIIDVILGHGFTILQELKTTLSYQQACEFYGEHENKDFYPQLVKYMSSGPVVCLHLRRECAVGAWRHLLGPTNYQKAKSQRPDSLRAKFAIDDTANACHGSDSESSVKRELAFFFSIGGNLPSMYLPSLSSSNSHTFTPVSIASGDYGTSAANSNIHAINDFTAPKRYSSKVRAVPTISTADLMLMEAYANYQVEPVMKELLQNLMITRPEDVSGSALKILYGIHINAGKTIPVPGDVDSANVSVVSAGTKGGSLAPIVSPRSQPAATAL